MDIKARFEKALKLAGGAYSTADIVQALREGRMQAWGDGERAWVITEIGVYPHLKVLQIVVAAGELDAVMALQPEIEAFGREQGCKALLMFGRKGWAKVLPDHGWKEAGVMYRVELDA